MSNTSHIRHDVETVLSFLVAREVREGYVVSPFMEEEQVGTRKSQPAGKLTPAAPEDPERALPPHVQRLIKTAQGVENGSIPTIDLSHMSDDELIDALSGPVTKE